MARKSNESVLHYVLQNLKALYLILCLDLAASLIRLGFALYSRGQKLITSASIKTAELAGRR